MEKASVCFGKGKNVKHKEKGWHVGEQGVVGRGVSSLPLLRARCTVTP